MKGSKQDSETQRNTPKGIAGPIGKKSKVKVVEVDLDRKAKQELCSTSKASGSDTTNKVDAAKVSGKTRKSKKASAPKSTTSKTSSKKSAAKKAKSKKTATKAKTLAKKKAGPTKSKAKKVTKKTAVKAKPAKKAVKKPSSKSASVSAKTKATSKKSVKKSNTLASTKSNAKKSNKKAAESVSDTTTKASRKKKAVTRLATKAKRNVRAKASEGDKAEAASAPVKIASPTFAALRPFREAAKQNKKRQKEKSRGAGKNNAFLAKPPRKGKKYTVDLRIHTPASLGFFSTGGVDPAPALVRLARVKGLHMIGLTDWFSASFIDEVKSLSEASDVTIIPGIDMRCKVSDCDEITITALFPEHYGSEDLNRVLDELDVPESARGRRDYCLTTTFGETVNIIESNEGCIIPSRIDKTPFRHLAIPTMVEEYGFHAFDLVHPENPEFFKNNWPDGEFTFFSFSNANALGQVGSRTSSLKLSESGYAGLKGLVQRR
jgi:hypothetical protein